MLRPITTTQLQFIGESEEGKAFAYRDFCEEFKNCGANALPLQNIVAVGNRNFDHPIKNHRKALPPPFTHIIAIIKR